MLSLHTHNHVMVVSEYMYMYVCGIQTAMNLMIKAIGVCV